MSVKNGSTYPINYAEQLADKIQVKVGLIGDAEIGKTSLMVRYCDGSFDEDYIQTLGVNFLEKTIAIRSTELTFSIWDLGGQREFINMLPIVSNEAAAIIFMFDLTRKATLNSVRNWYRQARGFNKTAVPLLVGTKFDLFYEMSDEEQIEITEQAKKYAKAMRAPLIFCSTSQGINIAKIFKIIIAKTFDLKLKLPELTETGEPLVIYSQW
ncbi:Ras family GTPase [Starmerella bacillaris]|uniref:Ras family GTPase n=1 Tax=Starmerella bacillaris TaxID=1247836 RepID=A0AAV5RJR1_STABA|nr:Ras family GTPase [Starmerella bacillaris]